MTSLKAKVFTAGQLRRGLELLDRPAAAAIMFGLETGADIDDVVTLKWPDVKLSSRTMSKYGRHLVRLQPIRIGCQYVFWREGKTQPMPLFDLSQSTLDVFGMMWHELVAAYDEMVMVDEDAEFENLMSVVSKISAA